MIAELVSLATEITREHDAACRAAESAITHARRAGELLTEVKTALEHGAWLPWLAAHCPDLSSRVAQGYMRIAREWPRLEANTKHVSHLPVREALTLLADPRPGVDWPKGYQPEYVDWPARTAAMEAAWDDLGAALDDFDARGPATSLETAADRVHEANELEARTMALYASTIRDLRYLARELSAMLDLPVGHIRPLTEPDRVADFLAACRARIAEIEAPA